MVLLDGTSVMRCEGTPRKPIGGSLSFGSVVLSSQRQRHDGGCIGNMPSSLGMAFGISETAFAPGVLPGDVRHGIVNDRCWDIEASVFGRAKECQLPSRG